MDAGSNPGHVGGGHDARPLDRTSELREHRGGFHVALSRCPHSDRGWFGPTVTTGLMPPAMLRACRVAGGSPVIRELDELGARFSSSVFLGSTIGEANGMTQVAGFRATSCVVPEPFPSLVLPPQGTCEAQPGRRLHATPRDV